MPNERLTDKTEKTSGFDENDVTHNVDTNDTAQHASGSSFFARFTNIIGELGARKILGCLVIKNNVSPNNLTIQDDDWVFYLSDTRMVIGVAEGNITSVPAHFDDDALFIKFYDGIPIS